MWLSKQVFILKKDVVISTKKQVLRDLFISSVLQGSSSVMEFHGLFVCLEVDSHHTFRAHDFPEESWEPWFPLYRATTFSALNKLQFP